MPLDIEFYMFPLQSFKVVTLNFNSNQRENYFFKSMVKEPTLSKFYLYSILNQRDKLFREKISTKYSFRKERKVFCCHKR